MNEENIYVYVQCAFHTIITIRHKNEIFISFNSKMKILFRHISIYYSTIYVELQVVQLDKMEEIDTLGGQLILIHSVNSHTHKLTN